MKTLAFANIFMLFAALAMVAQRPANEPCPKIWIKPPEKAGAYFKRGGTYKLEAWISSFHGSDIKYNWKYPNDLRFTGQGESELTFVADDSFGFRDVEVSVEIDGLPANCPNTASASFQVLFNPGSPLIFDEFGILSAKEEFVRLGIMVQQLNNLEGQKALFVVGYASKDSKRKIRRRIQRIESTLVSEYKLPRTLFQFVFEHEPRQISTTIYAWPIDQPPGSYWLTDLDKLKVRK